VLNKITHWRKTEPVLEKGNGFHYDVGCGVEYAPFFQNFAESRDNISVPLFRPN
jgi:hypothetical protein